MSYQDVRVLRRIVTKLKAGTATEADQRQAQRIVAVALQALA